MQIYMKSYQIAQYLNWMPPVIPEETSIPHLQQSLFCVCVIIVLSFCCIHWSSGLIRSVCTKVNGDNAGLVTWSSSSRRYSLCSTQDLRPKIASQGMALQMTSSWCHLPDNNLLFVVVVPTSWLLEFLMPSSLEPTEINPKLSVTLEMSLFFGA